RRRLAARADYRARRPVNSQAWTPALHSCRERLGQSNKMFQSQSLGARVPTNRNQRERAVQLLLRPFGLQQLQHHLTSLREAALYELSEQWPLFWQEQRGRTTHPADTRRIDIRFGKEATGGYLEPLAWLVLQ